MFRVMVNVGEHGVELVGKFNTLEQAINCVNFYNTVYPNEYDLHIYRYNGKFFQEVPMMKEG